MKERKYVCSVYLVLFTYEHLPDIVPHEKTRQQCGPPARKHNEASSGHLQRIALFTIHTKEWGERGQVTDFTEVVVGGVHRKVTEYLILSCISYHKQ